MPQLLILDIDGTLRPQGEPRVPRENADAVAAIQRHGVQVAIATGRCPAPRWRMLPATSCTPPA